MTIILGIDPGTIITGYGLLKIGAKEYSALDYGCIRPPCKAPLADRYCAIYDGLLEILDRFTPEMMAIETQYIGKNPQSTLKLGMARGIALLAARQKGLQIFEYTPSKAKLAITGTGRASKQQVQGMIQRVLALAEPPQPEDAADALALAYCHANALKNQRLIGAKL